MSTSVMSPEFANPERMRSFTFAATVNYEATIVSAGSPTEVIEPEIIAPSIVVPEVAESNRGRFANVRKMFAVASLAAMSLAACAPTVGGGTGETTTTTSSTTTTTTPTYGPMNYLYADAYENGLNVKGVSVVFDQAKPKVGIGNSHSLFEIALQDIKGNAVEFGWTVDNNQFPDKDPRTFNFTWKGGNSRCYNLNCGDFVQTSTTLPIAMKVTPGTSAKYEVIHDDALGQWQIKYNDQMVGYYPDANIWGAGEFTRAATVQVYGEVANYWRVDNCDQMGNGISGEKAGAAKVNQISYTLANGTKGTPNMATMATNPALYNIGKISSTSYGIGGSGNTAACTPTSLTQGSLRTQAESFTVTGPAQSRRLPNVQKR